MLLLNADARDEELVGEWVAVHELLHLGMPLVADAWMAEGFVTYYTQILRGRLGVIPGVHPRAGESPEIAQHRAALEKLCAGFDRRVGLRSLASASADMHHLGGYGRVYWGGAALALDLDLSIRRASGGRRSLDDLVIAMHPKAFELRRWPAEELVAFMDEEVERWREAGELESEISPSELVARHLRSKSIPGEQRSLAGLAIELERGKARLLDAPAAERQLREQLFSPPREGRELPENRL
jgi:hypothetical protein